MLSAVHTVREPFSPEKRGFHVIYRENETNNCPGCGRTHWIIGRVTAECAFCGTALPLEQSAISSRETIVSRFRKEPNKRCL